MSKRNLLRSMSIFLGLATSSYVYSSKITTFWNWFEKNEVALFKVETAQEPICDSLMVQMHAVHPSLTFEFGPILDNRREFVISADLDIEAFPHVVALYDSAVALSRWRWTKFGPRREPFDITLNSVTVKADSLRAWVYRSSEEGRADVLLIMPGYDELQKDSYSMIAWLMLKDALGECDVMTRVGRVTIVGHREKKGFDLDVPLSDFPRVFDAFLSFPRQTGIQTPK